MDMGPDFMFKANQEMLFNKRDFTPRHMRNQMYDGTPVANDNVEESDLDIEKNGRVNPETGMREYVKLTSADDSYGRGFEDGCHTATGIMGAGLLRLNKPRIYSDNLINDPWYLRGFQDASTYCTFRLDWETH